MSASALASAAASASASAVASRTQGSPLGSEGSDAMDLPSVYEDTTLTMAHMGPADTIRVLTEAKNQALEQIQRLMTTLKLLMEEKSSLKAQVQAVGAEAEVAQRRLATALADLDVERRNNGALQAALAQRMGERATNLAKEDLERQLAITTKELEKLRVENAMANAEIRKQRAVTAAAVSSLALPEDMDPALQAQFLRMKQERDVALQGLKLMQLTLKEAQASAAEAGLRPEEATLLGERNSLLHYATKLERAQKEAAESAQRRLDGSVKMVRLFSVLERVHSRTLARRFAVWRMLTFAQDELGVSGRAATTPAAAAAAASRGGGSDATAAAIATTASLCTAADSLLSALGPLHDRDTPPTAAVMQMSRDVSTLGRRVRDAVAGCLAHLRQKDEAEAALAAALREEVRSAAAAADKFKAQLQASDVAIAGLTQRCGAADERASGLVAQLDAVGRDVAGLVEALGGRPSAKPSAGSAPPGDGSSAVPSLTDLAVTSPHALAFDRSRAPSDVVVDGHRVVAGLCKNLGELHSLLAALPAADAAAGDQKLAVSPSDSLGDLVSKCRTLAMVCVSASVAKDKVMHERELALAAAHAELEAARAEHARTLASAASAEKVADGANAALVAAMGEVQAEKARALQLLDRATASDVALAKCSADLDKVTEELQGAQAALQLKEGEVQRIKDSLAQSQSAHTKASDLAKECETLNADVQRLTAEVARGLEARSAAEAAKAAAEAAARNSKDALDVCQAKLRTAEADLVACQEQLRSSKAAIVDMQAALDGIHARITAGEFGDQEGVVEDLATCLRSCGPSLSATNFEPPAQDRLTDALQGLLKVLGEVGGESAGAVLDRLKWSLDGTEALAAQLVESEAANYELAGMVKQLRTM